VSDLHSSLNYVKNEGLTPFHLHIQTGEIYDTAAAAYAESGDFKEAIAMEEKAIDLLASKEIKKELMAILENHLNSYKNGIPWRDKTFSTTDDL
jgi:hypothetical protein